MITINSNHLSDARSRYLEQYKSKPFFDGLVEALIKPIQSLEEDCFSSFYIHNSIDTAEGLQLDLFGEIVGLTRVAGQNDADYRIQLKGRVGQNVSKGQVETLISNYLTLTNATVAYVMENLNTISIQGNLTISDQDYANSLFKELEKSAAAGVRIGYLIEYEGEGFSFEGSDIGLGFGSSTDIELGGKFATVHTRKNLEFSFNGTDNGGGGFGTVHDPLVGGIIV